MRFLSLYSSLFILLIILTQNLAFCQDTVPKQPFVKLKNGTLLKGSVLKYDENTLRPDIITLDSNKIKSVNVLFYGDGSEKIYARIGHLTKSHAKKDNLYFFTTISGGGGYNGPSRTVRTQTPFGYTHTRTGGGSSRPIMRDYFCDGISTIKRLTAKNIAPYIVNNEIAEQGIKKAVRYRNISFAFLGMGCGFTMMQFAAMKAEADKPKKPLTNISAYGALLGFGTGYVFYEIQWRKKRKVVDDYFGIMTFS